MAWVNTNHSVLGVDEREAVAGALVALRQANVAVDRDAVRVLVDDVYRWADAERSA